MAKKIWELVGRFQSDDNDKSNINNNENKGDNKDNNNNNKNTSFHSFQLGWLKFLGGDCGKVS